ncbi:ricin-type beta-trefoil lectin domain protein [Streptomyces sp. NPDC060010]|uniref:ricin-type beta-trefoil lectin domain protein n=1 Tax=Streptomyces sp. NPDC060010 TaxID=3347036 RepID=UPI0036C95DD1
MDPNNTLTDVTTAAASEWQQEIVSQQAQRNQILTANTDATKALTAGAKALGEMLGHSWVADHAARFQDYWSPGGVGAVGDKPAVIAVHAANGKCLDIENGGTGNGAPVQIYTCNGTAAQQWTMFGDDHGFHLRSATSQKCLDVSNAGAANGTRIQIWTCNSTPAQTWEFNLRATTSIKNVGSGKCLDLHTYELGNDAWLWECNGTGAQQFDIKPSGNGGVPGQWQFTKAKAAITGAQAGAKKQLDVLKAQAAAAKKAATTSDAASQAAYGIADAGGAPRGRGLLVGQQKAQVTKGAVAALDAMVKAGETAEAATRASAGDSETIAQRALAQAAQAKAEFRREAARTAEAQAKAAADGAKAHRDNAKKDAATAKAKLGDAVKAEAAAKAAAADARAKRLAAEAEEATAKKEKATAATKQAEAAQHKQNAQAEAANAQTAKANAEASEKTALQRRDGAVTARNTAKAKRDDAWNAEQLASAERAKADAKEAYAASLDAGTEADAARAAADQADTYATQAETAAGRARGEADAATKAAADAVAAATRAEAAAKRSRANADAAQAAKLKADAAVRTATSAAADAISASQHAASEARTAVALADEADAKAKTAKTQADLAGQETVKAVAASAKAAGYAYVTAQAAVDAGNAAADVAKPANDAIQLGSPYATTDSTASLLVLTGQASKTIAEQQKAIADAHAKNAQEEAASAKALADQAQGDTKAAYQHAANAAGYAADARGYSKEALSHAADAANSASLAAASLARTTEFGRQATADAIAADKAAGRSEGYAKAARDSADQAALDAAAARTAAAQAEQAAKDARAAADRAAVAATEAEQAAKDADKYAKEAQEAAERAETKTNNDQITTGASTGIGNVFIVTKNIETIGEPKITKKENCNPIFHVGDCILEGIIRYNADVDLYLCTAEDMPATQAGCPSSATVYLGSETVKDQEYGFRRVISMVEFNSAIDPVQILLGDFIECAQLLPGGKSGKWSGCAWAATWFIPSKAINAVVDGIRALDAAMKTGIGIADAARALKTLKLNPQVLAALEHEANSAEAMFTSCAKNSFPGRTTVLMADGSRRPINSLRVGDRVVAADPETGVLRSEPVIDTFQHSTDRMVTINLAGGSSLDTTPGHKIRTDKRGWILASELRVGDRLISPEGTLRTVTGMRDKSDIASEQVYDLTVDGLHTFYVGTEGPTSDLLVHNCLSLRDELLPSLRQYEAEIHTLKKHVNPTPVEAFAEAVATKKKVTIWTSEAIAQQAIDRVVSDYFHTRNRAGELVLDKGKWRSFEKWRSRARNGEQYPVEITGKWDAYPSLGKVYHPDGVTVTNAGNSVKVILMKVEKGHNGRNSGGYVVKTAYATGES